MKKSNFILFGMLTMMLTLGLVIVGCDDGNNSNGGGNTDPKSVKIENISLSGQAGVFVFAELPQGNNMPAMTAIRYGNITNNTLSVDLTVPRDTTYETSNKWSGNGDYYVALIPTSGGSIQTDQTRIFTNGGNSPAKVTFDKALVTLDFGKFKKSSEL